MRDAESLKEEQRTLKKGIHELYNSLIVKELGESSHAQAIEFNKYWNILKDYRIDADYNYKDFDKHDYGIAIGYAENLTNQLREKFNVK